MLPENRFQTIRVDGPNVIIKRKGRPEEVHVLGSADEGAGRAAIVAEALTWIGTPFINCGDVKGPKGGIDCAMLLVRAYVDTGRLAPFDPRPYPPHWFLHHSEERFLGIIENQLHARQVEKPKLGDVVIYRFGRCFSHGGVIANNEEIVHAFFHAGSVILSRRDEDVLRYISTGAQTWTRPLRYYDVWSA